MSLIFGIGTGTAEVEDEERDDERRVKTGSAQASKSFKRAYIVDIDLGEGYWPQPTVKVEHFGSICQLGGVAGKEKNGQRNDAHFRWHSPRKASPIYK